ncbi:MAG: hypothetical protein II192_06105 [Clostridia bacterium]|nr:hypothetical protein [Clostridia bacterium]
MKEKRKTRAARTENGKGGGRLWLSFLRAAAFTLLLLLLFLLLSSAVIFRTADPARYAFLAAGASLFFGAAACGFFSVRFCPGRPLFAALAVSSAFSLLALILSLCFSLFSERALAAYAAFILLSLLFARLFSLKPGKRRTRRRF